jgi:hypothetical protein
MDVEDAEEDGDTGGRLEKKVGGLFLDDFYDPAVRRSQNQTVTIPALPSRVPKEIDGEKSEDPKDHGKAPE